MNEPTFGGGQVEDGWETLTRRIAAGLCEGFPQPTAVCWGPEAEVTACNKGFSTLPDVHQPIVGRPLRAVLPRLRQHIEPLYYEVLRSGEPVGIADVGWAPLDDIEAERHFQVTCCPIPGHDRKPAGGYVTCLDITQQVLEHRHLEALARLASTTGQSLQIDAVAALTLDELMHILRLDIAALYLREGDTARLLALRGAPALPPEGQSIPLTSQRVVAQAIREGQTILLERRGEQYVGETWVQAVLEQIKLGSGLAVPIRGRRGTFGAFVYARTTMHRYADEEIQRIEALVAQSGVALENALLYQEANGALTRLRGILSHAPVGIAVYEAEEPFRCLEHNPSFLRLVGQHFQEQGSIIGVELRALFSAESAAAVSALFNQVKSSGKVITIDEFPAVLLPDPKPRYYTCSLTPLWRDQSLLSGLMVSAVEITSLVQARQRIEELAVQAEARASDLEAVIAAITDGVVVLDVHAEVILINEAGRQLLQHTPGMRADVQEQQPVFALRDAESGQLLPSERLPSRRALAGETVVATIVRTRRAGAGEDSWLSISATPLHARDGAVRGAVLTFHDITREKEIERERDDFLSVASHELKTPLTSVKGMIQVAQRRLEKGAGERARTALAQADAESDRLHALIEELLDIGRFQSGREIAFERRRLDLAELAHRAVERIRTENPVHSLRFEVDAAPLWVDGDERRLAQVLDNLLSNAMKYMPLQGEVLVQVQSSSDEALVRVTDQGIGVPPGSQERIFARFYRAGNANVRQFTGLGVGLWLGRQIMERHGGRLWLVSSSAQGSSFCMALPLADYAAEAERRA